MWCTTTLPFTHVIGLGDNWGTRERRSCHIGPQNFTAVQQEITGLDESQQIQNVANVCKSSGMMQNPPETMPSCQSNKCQQSQSRMRELGSLILQVSATSRDNLWDFVVPLYVLTSVLIQLDPDIGRFRICSSCRRWKDNVHIRNRLGSTWLVANRSHREQHIRICPSGRS